MPLIGLTGLSHRSPTRILFIGSILAELLNLALSVTQASPSLKAVVCFPSLFVLPGVLLITTFRRRAISAQMLTVEGFFLSTVTAVLLTALILSLGLSITALVYSGAAFLLVTILVIACLIRRTKLELGESDLPLLGIMFASFVGLFVFFTMIPRFFGPDETSYIFSARMGTLTSIVPPIGGRPNQGLLLSAVDGRYTWTYLLISFLSSSNLAPKETGLIGVSFVVMTALTSSLFVKSRWLSRGIFLTVLSSPIIISFIALTLNDLAFGFYATIAGFYFVRSFSRAHGHVSLDARNLLLSFIAGVTSTLLKLNPVVLVSIWTIAVFVVIRSRLYRGSRADRLLSGFLIIPPILYELLIDLPYFIPVDIFRSGALRSTFGTFLPISPAEILFNLFFAPWWNPTAKTLLTTSSTDYLDYFYRLLMPESLSLLVSAIVFALPILLWSKDSRKELSKLSLGAFVMVLMLLYYVETVRFSTVIDVTRYSLALAPLAIPLAYMILEEIKSKPTLERVFPVFFAALILLWANIWLTTQEGGVYVGWGVFHRVVSIDVIMLELSLLALILALPFLAKRFPISKFNLRIISSALRFPRTENAIYCLIVVLILLNGAYFSEITIGMSPLYGNGDFSSMANTMESLSGNGTPVFTNNYVQLRPYASDRLLSQGLLLAPPTTEDEFQDLLRTAPNGSLILISNDTATTSYEYGSTYLARYFGADFITPDKPDVSRLRIVNLTQPFLLMTFDDANTTTVPDHSGWGNTGANYGAAPVSGYYGGALNFSGASYVSITSNDQLNVQNQISISFLAKIQAAEPLRGHMILSKGYGAGANGSYDVFVFNSNLFFELGNVGSLSVPATPYLGSWHQFAFTYDGKTMDILVDGILKNSKQATGFVRPSGYNLEIGRDSERGSYYFVGTIDELQVSSNPLNLTEVVSSSFDHYAIQVARYSSGAVYADIYKTISRGTPISENGVRVEYPRSTIESNQSIGLDVYVLSTTTRNVTVLVGTDAFTDVHVWHLSPGENDLRYQFDFVIPAGGRYWVHLSQARIILLDEGVVRYNQFIVLQSTERISNLVLLWAAGTLVCFILLSFKKRYHD